MKYIDDLSEDELQSASVLSYFAEANKTTARRASSGFPEVSESRRGSTQSTVLPDIPDVSKKIRGPAAASTEGSGIPAPSLTKRRPLPANTSRKRTKKDPWSPETVTIDPRSPLAFAPIRKILASPQAWELLTPDQQATIAKSAPPGVFKHQDDGLVVPDPHFIKYDTDFSSGVANWLSDLVDGRNDVEWQRQALVALKEREAGKFDAFKEKESEEFWGQKQEFPAKPPKPSTRKVQTKTPLACQLNMRRASDDSSGDSSAEACVAVEEKLPSVLQMQPTDAGLSLKDRMLHDPRTPEGDRDS